MCYDLKKGSVWIVLLAILVWIAQPVAGQVKAATSLVLNLRNYGWEPPDRHQVETPSIVVDHEGRVLVGFTVSERKWLVTRTQPSLSFRIIRFSANGEADLSLSLPTNAAGRTALYLSDTDQIIARANDNLQVVQPSERDVQERVWKLLTACTPRWHIEQSFSRHTLLLFTEEADPVTLIHLSQPPVVRSCGKGPKVMNSDEDKVQNWPSSITDEFSYFLGGGEAYRWPFCDYEHRVELPLNAQGRDCAERQASYSGHV
jgi:hypothetical protein